MPSSVRSVNGACVSRVARRIARVRDELDRVRTAVVAKPAVTTTTSSGGLATVGKRLEADPRGRTSKPQ